MPFAAYDNSQDVEFLASLIRRRKTLKQAVKQAQDIISEFGSFPAVLAAPRHVLESHPHITVEIADSLISAHSTILNVIFKRIENKSCLDSPDELIRYVMWKLAPSTVEQCLLIFLDARAQVTGSRILSTGTTRFVQVDIRTLMAYVLDARADAFIVAHNHPSGILEPSREDKLTTIEIERGCHHLGIRLVDHVIVGNGKWFSFLASGLLGQLETKIERKMRINFPNGRVG